MDIYSHMADGELEELLENPESLTDVARMVLKGEIARRGLSSDLEDAPPAIDKTEFHELVTIREFRDLQEALLAKGLLESSGIERLLIDDNMVGLNWLISTAIGGVKLQVKSEDSEEAIEILDQPVLDNSEDEGQTS
jgi:hypothetical protein